MPRKPWLLFVVACAIVTLSAQSSLAPVEACGTDRTAPAPHVLSRETIALAADRRLMSPCPTGAHPDDHLERRDLALLDAALAASDVEYRRLAVQAFGRFAGRSLTPRIHPALDDASPIVRREAANALGQALSGLRSDLRDDPAPTPADVRLARERLEARLAKEEDDRVAATIVATLGRMRHDAADLDGVEQLLVERSAGTPIRLLGAAEGFEALARRNPRRPLGLPARNRLREMSTLGRTTAGPATATLVALRRMSMTALQVARDTDIVSQLAAATDPDWQVRRLAVQMMNSAVNEVRPAILLLLKDPQLHVRLEAVRTFSRGLTSPGDCGPLVTAVNDAAVIVSLQAIDGLSPRCTDLPAIITALTPIAAALTGVASATNWHRPARALTALARLAPEQARPHVSAAATHAVWQVRAAAVSAAATLDDVATVERLAGDAAPNVRTAAIDALVRLKSPRAVPLAIAQLAATDHQLLRAAAGALRGTTDPAAIPALLAALRRLTAGASDTSRDPRVAMVERLAELLGPGRVNELGPWVLDWDTAVRAAAMRAFSDAGVAVAGTPLYRYPLQPGAGDLRDHLRAREADIVLATGGTITIRFFGADAPLTVSRFVTRARAGLYDGLTFHRVVPNFVVQGLSPGANEYVGDDRFMRDEVGRPHLRGAVGISTRGYDTGDAQIFFDLVDVPRLNHEYTVFGEITSGLEHLDTMLEGAAVARVVIR